MSFDRSRLPDPAVFFEGEGLKLTGRGKWRTTRCDLHGGSDSMRVNVESGAWRCMSCQAKGGDVIAYRMQAHGEDFVRAVKALGAWVNDGKPMPHAKPLPFSTRAAVEVLRDEALLVVVAGCNIAHGNALTRADLDRVVKAVGRIEYIYQEVGR